MDVGEKRAEIREIRKAIAILHEPGRVVELRALGEFGTATGYFADSEKLAKAVKELSDSGEFDSLYYTLNPCHDALLARRHKNRIYRNVKQTTSDAEIVRRHWLLVDADPTRPKGVSATGEEKRAAKKLILEVAKALRKRGWPLPVIALSGNGYHLLFRVDEPNNAETSQLFKNCLEAIAAQFPSDTVDIDTKVFNASRITKAYGSLAAKGEDTDDRPHRFSKILSVPNPVCTVKRSQLKKLASVITNRKKQSQARQKEGTTISPDVIEEFLAWGDVTVKSVSDTADGGKKWILAACPFNADHTNSPAVFQSADGVFGFKCFHASCGDKSWKEFRNALEREMGEKFQFATRENTAPYESTPEGIVHHAFAQNGERTKKLLTNFTARILTNIIEDDGIEKKNVLEIEAHCRGRKKRFCVPASDFANMGWAIEKLGGEAIIAAGMGKKDHARAAIQFLSDDIKRRVIHTHTGWRRIGGERLYLHGDGAIGESGLKDSVKVRLPQSLAAFRLPQPPSGARLKNAVRASLRFLDLAPHSLTVPMFAAIWRAVLGGSDSSLHAVGPTGTFKTSVAALAMQHLGAGFDSRHVPGSWSSTANANAAMQFTLKDALFLIDDFVPRGSRADVERSHRDADRIFRGQGNISGRGRLGRDGVSQRDPNPPRGLTLSTGEDIPRGESLASRFWRLDFSPGDVDVEKLTACQHDAGAGVYASAMAAFLQYLAPRYKTIKRGIPEIIEKFRAKATRDAQHSRTPEITASLAIGIRYFLRFATHIGALTNAEAKKIFSDAWVALQKCASAQARGQASEESAQRFMELIASALSSGDVSLANVEMGRSVRDAKARIIGWIADDLVLLEPDSSYATAHRLAEQQGEGLPVTKNTMWKRLKERGYLARYGKGHNTIQYTVAGGRRRVLCVRKADLHLASDTTDADYMG